MERGNAERTILIVDDDADIRTVLGLLLAEEGYDVLQAADGADALRVLRRSVVRPELILLDLRMPIMNGWEFREEQLRDPCLATIPVVVITADGSAATRTVAGAAGHLSKPLRFDQLLDTIGRIANQE